MRIWHGRHAQPLIVIWAIALTLSALLYWIQNRQPAFTELLRPVYAVIVGVALLVTWNWFRARGRTSHNDRRHGDRRHDDRRDE